VPVPFPFRLILGLENTDGRLRPAGATHRRNPSKPILSVRVSAFDVAGVRLTADGLVSLADLPDTRHLTQIGAVIENPLALDELAAP
jgi:hypothetical protein